ncbi:RNA-binding domain-containing protein [Sodiomyces alkalinus F11]|uniref:RNA-binding domain-containing protein n=1 Tax=Sodiomyces alkalinus (strain CBS 110278 / VKM F-3762 / F11) TaxID=1314773 RepID=A0A3N2PSE8_SODAK|nr:RNA-binding domain-containing protein [Sodiomyces alkalinus F11]ROT37410.1 RNA-binding domain-containing protein [Sodiomyces alkalinus F11]
MAYPPPPGISNVSRNTSTAPGAPHPSLPARPPASSSVTTEGGFKSSFKPAFSTPAPPAYSSAPGYGTGAPPAPGQYGPSSYPSYTQAPASSSVSAAPYQSRPTSYQYNQRPNYQQSGYHATTRNGATFGPAVTPQIRNPFPAPSATADSSYDPEMAAQIAQWQSAYAPRDSTTNVNGPTGPTIYAAPTVTNPTAQSAADATAAAANPPEKQKTVAREGGGKKWTDDSLLEWDPSHLRLFVGNLAGEVTDDSLLKAFARWQSVQRARVIRDKRTSKSKGYGFVSFSDADDFFQAAKEMNGKYIQSHPVVVRKAKTEIKVTNVKGRDSRGGGKKHKSGSGAGAGGRQEGAGGASYDSVLGPTHHGGVTKPGQKTKNGLKLLG